MSRQKKEQDFDFLSAKSTYYLTRILDGWYVVGNGEACSVASAKEGHAYIRELNALQEVREIAKKNKD